MSKHFSNFRKMRVAQLVCRTNELSYKHFLYKWVVVQLGSLQRIIPAVGQLLVAQLRILFSDD